jgi:ABC-type transport system involved in cytochrome c biogenesis permease subunit
MRDESGNENLPKTSAGGSPVGAAASEGEQARPMPQPASLPSHVHLLPPPLHLCLRGLASLQLAVVAIAVYAVVLAAATFIEKYHGSAAARGAVYDTAWFAAIHVVLAVNVLSAMLIRLPWRWRQIGFLVTHGGILVLLAGCALTHWKGVEAQLSVYEGHAAHVAAIDRPQKDGEDEKAEPLDLGFQVYLHQFRRRLDPGSGMPSLYSSRVDFLALSNPPKPLKDEKKLREDVLITLNAPVDFTDPQKGRTYRFFQASFREPWLPGDAEFDELAGDDRSRDQIYLSVLSMNYDPGRGLKYLGSLLIVVGIGIVYDLRRVAVDKSLAVSHAPSTSALRREIMLASVAVFFLGASVHAEDEPLDWSTWRHLPVLSEGRVAPLDTFARQTVEMICGRANPALRMSDAQSDGETRKFEAAKLFFSWLVEPEKWEHVPFLPADEELRKYLYLRLWDKDGRWLRGASPAELEGGGPLLRRWDKLHQRVEEGRNLDLSSTEKDIGRLLDALGKYRRLTLDPKSPQNLLWWPSNRARMAADALKRLSGDPEVAKRISSDAKTAKLAVQVVDAWQKIIAAMHGGGLSREKIEPAVAEFARAADRLASRLATPDDAALTALAVNLRHQAAEMQMAFYGAGEILRLVPALDAGALEENRTPEDDASPWLSFQALLYGSDDLLRAYPQSELKKVRKAFTEVKAAYLDRGAADRPHKFSVAMKRFAESLRALAERIEPLRQQLPLRHRDRELIEATAYPPAGSTAAEVFYNRLDPFFWSWAVSLAATLCLVLAVGRWREQMFWLGAAVLVAGQAIGIAGMGLRGYITGLAPLTGMFETVEFVALYAGLLGLWFTLSPLWRGNLRPRCDEGEGWALQCPPTEAGSAITSAAGAGETPAPQHLVGTEVPTPRAHEDFVFQRRLFAVAGAIVSFTAAALAYYAPATVMHRDIGAVTPILRDNFWLAVHVVTIMASYASAAVALILGCIALGYYLFGRYSDESNTHRLPPEACHTLAGFIYTAIKITVLLLAAGTILGALWADQAWGHFWSWDPKETWALISLLVYLLILHLRCLILRTRSLGWSGDFAMAVAAVFGFTAIVCTWYFVNFVWGSGMHSYGSGSGGMWAVIGAIAATWLFLSAAAARHLLEIVGRSLPASPQPSPIAENEETGGTSC